MRHLAINLTIQREVVWSLAHINLLKICNAYRINYEYISSSKIRANYAFIILLSIILFENISPFLIILLIKRLVRKIMNILLTAFWFLSFYFLYNMNISFSIILENLNNASRNYLFNSITLSLYLNNNRSKSRLEFQKHSQLKDFIERF